MNSDSNNKRTPPAWPFEWGWSAKCTSVDQQDPTQPNIALDGVARKQGRTMNEAPPGNNGATNAGGNKNNKSDGDIVCGVGEISPLDLSIRSDLTQDRLPEDYRPTIQTCNKRRGRQGRRGSPATTSSSSIRSSASSIQSCLGTSSRAAHPRHHVCNPSDPFLHDDREDESLGTSQLLRMLLSLDEPPPGGPRPVRRAGAASAAGRRSHSGTARA